MIRQILLACLMMVTSWACSAQKPASARGTGPDPAVSADGTGADEPPQAPPVEAAAEDVEVPPAP